MFAMRALFEAQFEPHDGGFVFYPTVWSGGRLVTAAEADAMRQQNARLTRFVYSWRGLLLLVVGTVLYSFVSSALDPSRAYHDLTFATFIGVVTAEITAGPWLAPASLVRGREVVKPRRDRRARIEAQREARAAMRRPLIISSLILALLVGAVVAAQFALSAA